MNARDERVDDRDELAPGFGFEDGAVVADADHDAARILRTREIRRNQLELIHCLEIALRARVTTGRRRRDRR